MIFDMVILCNFDQFDRNGMYYSTTTTTTTSTTTTTTTSTTTTTTVLLLLLNSYLFLYLCVLESLTFDKSK